METGPGKVCVVFRGGPLDGHRREVRELVFIGSLLDVLIDNQRPITYRVVTRETGGYVVADYEEGTDAAG